MNPASPTALDDEMDAFLRWLESEPADEVFDDLAALRAHLEGLGQVGQADAVRLRCLEGAALRALDISGRIRAQLQEVSLPLQRALHVATNQLCQVLVDIAEEASRCDGEPCRHLGLSLCFEAFVVSVMSAANPPPGLWQLAHRIADLLAGDVSYAAMGLIAAAQPESFTARQLAWIADFVVAELAGLRLAAESEADESVWWVDPLADAAPVSAARRPPPAGKVVRYFSTAPVALRLLEPIRQLEQQVLNAETADELVEAVLLDVEDAALPPGLAPSEMLALLRILYERWSNSPLREQPRRHHHYKVQVCLGLRTLWELGQGRRETGRVRDWQVLNESPGGYAVMNVVGIEAQIAAGIVLGLRRQPGEPWTVCLVRWVRSDNPDQIELGLQVLSPSYTAVQVAFRGASLNRLVPALALPVLQPLRHHPAILAPTGTYASRRFVFVRESTHLYVASGRAFGLDMQTASVELFQYEVDPSPL